MKTIFINMLTFGTLISSVLAITSKNPVVSVIFVISTFVNAAWYLLLLGVNFVGISYIVIYVGAIAVLFLFVIMMINIKLTDILETGSQYTKNLPLALTIGFLFIYIVFTLIPVSLNIFSYGDSLSLFLDSITNLNAFLILIALSYFYTSALKTKSNSLLNSVQDIKYITELKGLFFNNPILSLSFTICLFSMAGVPPLLGFFSKQFVLYSAMQSEYYFIGIISILVSVITASYYLKIIKVLHTENKEIKIEEGSDIQSSIPSLHSFMISSLTLFILLFILKPSILLNSTQLLALSLFFY